MKSLREIPTNHEPEPAHADQDLLRRGIRLNTILLGIVTGVGSGLAVFVMTHLSLLITGVRAGRYLNLLGVFLPGYSASPEGAWIGLFWGLVFGAISGGFIYYTYARSIGAQLAASLASGAVPGQLIEQPILRLSGHSLGMALGLLMALQLFVATMWLVVRGTADHSPHAALLANYFPGYTVSFGGSLFGMAYIFIFTYVLSFILATVYNLVVSLRYRTGAS